MIKHHPKFEHLQSFVNGELPASIAAGIAIHAEMCPECQNMISQLTELSKMATCAQLRRMAMIILI